MISPSLNGVQSFNELPVEVEGRKRIDRWVQAHERPGACGERGCEALGEQWYARTTRNQDIKKKERKEDRNLLEKTA